MFVSVSFNNHFQFFLLLLFYSPNKGTINKERTKRFWIGLSTGGDGESYKWLGETYEVSPSMKLSLSPNGPSHL